MTLGLDAAGAPPATSCPDAAAQAVSTYWPKLDALCKKGSALLGARSRIPAADQAAFDEIVQFCTSGGATKPSAAAIDAVARVELLGRIAAAAGFADALTASAVQAHVEPVLDRLAKALGNEAFLRTGAAADYLVEQLRGAACDKPDVARWLPATCGGRVPAPALLELRKRLLRDLAALPGRAIRLGGDAALAAAGPEARAAAALLSTLASTAQPAELAKLLADLAPKRPPSLAACVPYLPSPDDVLGVAAHLLARLAEDGKRLFEQSADYAKTAILAELKKLKLVAVDANLTPPQVAAIEKLVISLRGFSSAQDALEAGKSALDTALREVVQGLVDVLESSLALTAQVVVGAPVLKLLPDVKEVALTLARGDAFAAIQPLLRFARTYFSIPVSDGVVKALNAGLDVTAAVEMEDAQRRIVRWLLGIGPWAAAVLFDINADVPRLQSGDLSIIGDLLLGYQGKRLGFTVRGAVNRWNFQSDDVFEDGLRAGGDLDAWAAFQLSRVVKLDMRFSGQFYLYDSTVAESVGAATFFDENSILTRAMLGIGLRAEKPRWGLGFWATAGGQLEVYDSIGAANSSISLNDETRITAIAQARLRAQLQVIPSWVAARLRVDATRFDLTRNSLNVTVGADGIVPVALEEKSTQVELFTRLFLDAEVLRFAGFVPGLNTGFDYVSRSSDTVNESSFVPVFGVGLRRVAF